MSQGSAWADAVVLAALAFAALGLAQTRQGVMRDEATYFHASETYWGFFQSLDANIKANATAETFTKKNIDRYFNALVTVFGILLLGGFLLIEFVL